MEVKLKVLEGTHAGKEIRLNKSRFLIGRAEDCHLRAGSELISRHHCALVISGSSVVVEDFGSRNGTLVNGERVEGKIEVRTGDRLRIGPLEFEIQAQHQVGGAKRPAVKDVGEAAARTVAASGKAVEDDISQWLGEPTSPVQANHETQSFKFANTERIEPVKRPAEPAAPAAPAADAGPKQPGKLPKIEAPKTKDSREAAANVLKMMAKRK